MQNCKIQLATIYSWYNFNVFFPPFISLSLQRYSQQADGGPVCE